MAEPTEPESDGPESFESERTVEGKIGSSMGVDDPPGGDGGDGGEGAGTDVSSPSRRELREAGVNDRPTTTDTLGFSEYVDVLETFLTHEDTSPPLTVGIEGPWGSGKSSLMKMLEARLEGEDRPGRLERVASMLRDRVRTRRTAPGQAGTAPPAEAADAATDGGTATAEGGDEAGGDEDDEADRARLTVFFDPWRHDAQDAIWAAFALEFLRQVRQALPWYRRWFGDISLAVRRIQWERGRSGLVVTGLLTLGVVVLALFLTGGLFLLGEASVHYAVDAAFGTGESQAEPGPVVNAVAQGGGVTVSLVAVLAVWDRVRSRVFDPLRADINRYLADPGYEDRVSFIEQFHEDFDHIVAAYAGDDPVYVFIDDLDRCRFSRVAELMGSLTLLLDNNPQVYFIFGMDRQKVAAGLAAKHGDLYEYLYDTGDEAVTKHDLGLRFGYEYLEKFIQIRVPIPQPESEDLDGFLKGLRSDDEERERETEPPHGTGNGKQPQVDIRELTDDELRDALELAAPLLGFKPRLLKMFVNQYRLDAMLAARHGWFAWDEEDATAAVDDVTHERLALSVAVRLAVRDLLAELGDPPTDPDRLARFYDGDVPDWTDDEVMLDILDSGLNPDRERGATPGRLDRIVPPPDRAEAEPSSGAA